ncbi:hypothetical protein DQ244_16100 [Blastococcus sp. TBT05-19]|uniref:hypothetical protein n=1 Tax=Blastococcus sp. TBT05-19 TaxID=2250581 RepID=UPI000DE92889|nr:hypothetical protein [Blastococcus sp. TBT05-19]RBY88080.1 hypothetical protein DQ244_16100 [Blastococcus sp. TBT05-19]
MRISCRATLPATDIEIATAVQQLLDRRGSMAHAPVTLTIPDNVAIGIAGFFVSPTDSGQLMERFFRGGDVDSNEMLEAIRFEQGYASPEGHAALHCLSGWVAAQVHKQGG